MNKRRTQSRRPRPEPIPALKIDPMAHFNEACDRIFKDPAWIAESERRLQVVRRSITEEQRRLIAAMLTQGRR